MRGQHRKPLMMRIPVGLREQPAWVFIGILFLSSGVGYLTGFTESNITHALGATGLRVWGGVLTLSGMLLIVATLRARPALEKLALRILTCNLIAYAGWLLAIVPIRRATTTVILSTALILIAEVRVLHLKLLIRSAEEIRRETHE